MKVPLLRAVAWSLEPLTGFDGSGFLESASGAPDASAVEPLLRRRLSALGRGMVHCAARVSEGCGPLRTVFASRHGEPGRAMPMLEDLAAGLDISPTQFSMNVLNAVAGVWSIARKDASEATALSAGPETFGWGLVEALSIHEASGETVLFVFGDDALPESLAEGSDLPVPLHALGLLIGRPARRRLLVERDALAEAATASEAQSLHAVRTLAGHAAGPWRGPRGVWTFALE